MDQFYPFPNIDKTTWLEKITKDLKGKELSSIDWQINPNFTINPVAHASDFKESHSAIAATKRGWEIGQELVVKDIKLANVTALKALEFGAESLHFILKEEIDKPQLLRLLENINLEYISLSFSSEVLQVALDLDLQHYKASMFDLAKARTRVFGFEIRLFETELSRSENMFERLAQLLFQTNTHFIDQIKNDELLSLSTWKVKLTGQYFVDIASLRALRLMLDKMIASYNWDFKPTIEACLEFASDEQVNQNRIAATSAAMSAVIGGVDRLFINIGDSEFERRIARNIQQLLKLESYMDQVEDPAAGSYYIEGITEQLIKQSWKIFQELEAKR